jgi:hypothetical protein
MFTVSHRLRPINVTVIHSGQCQWMNDKMPSVANSRRANVEKLRLFDNDTATGYFDIECQTGYAPDEQSSNMRITCLESGSWSTPLPKCNCQ